MSEVTPRLARRIRRDYGPGIADEVFEAMADIPEALPLAGKQSSERLQAAVVLGHTGTWESVVRRLTVLRQDWRDGLVAAGLENGDWSRRLDDELGPP
jgi:hypothetical protein